MAISNVAQFELLLWKNWLLQKRRLVATTFQIITPTLIAFLLLFFRLAVDSTFKPLATIWDSFEASTSFPSNLNFPMHKDASKSVTPNDTSNLSNWTIVFSPGAWNATIRMIFGVARMLDAIPKSRLMFSVFTFRILSPARRSPIAISNFG